MNNTTQAILKRYYFSIDSKDIKKYTKLWQVDLIKKYIEETVTPSKSGERDVIFVSILKKFEKVINKYTQNNWTFNTIYNDYMEEFFQNFIFEFDKRLISYNNMRKNSNTTQKLLEDGKRIDIYRLIKTCLSVAHKYTLYYLNDKKITLDTLWKSWNNISSSEYLWQWINNIQLEKLESKESIEELFKIDNDFIIDTHIKTFLENNNEDIWISDEDIDYIIEDLKNWIYSELIEKKYKKMVECWLKDVLKFLSEESFKNL